MAGNLYDWKEYALADVINLINGGTPKTGNPEYWNGDIPWLSIADFNNDFRHVYYTEKSISQAGFENSSTKILKKGQLIISTRGTVGAIAQLGRDMAFNQSCYGIDGKRGLIINDFLYYLIKFSVGKLQQITHGAVFDTITKDTFKYIVVRLPQLGEQTAIAHILGTLDDKIELNQQMNRNLEAIAQAIFKSWFVDFDPVRAKMEGREPVGMDAATAALFPDSFEDSPLGEIPKGWRVSTIGESVRVVGGSTPSTKETAYWEGGTIYWATPKDLASLLSPVIIDTERRITKLGLQQISSGLLPIGTVLLSSRAPIGYLALTEVPLAINQGFIAMICDCELPNHYVLQWTKVNMDAVKGRANGTTFLEISKTNFRPLNVVIPSSKILQCFTEQAAVLHQQLVNNLKQSLTLATTRDILLPKLISGEIRVKEAEKMVEAVA